MPGMERCDAEAAELGLVHTTIGLVHTTIGLVHTTIGAHHAKQEHIVLNMASLESRLVISLETKISLETQKPASF